MLFWSCTNRIYLNVLVLVIINEFHPAWTISSTVAVGLPKVEIENQLELSSETWTYPPLMYVFATFQVGLGKYLILVNWTPKPWPISIPMLHEALVLEE